ncbi:hypothetical protein BDP27DRAFT_1334817 [Rhodocollybia butyracea]|uniref:Uncharacterized protein n=1 Tax=Rhodocollybia butyracea TaxID=206335 RepID=A0A9P5PI07_9AGAR|nr:hypothetical protein BDP27DRAFT_1334817 [Rhodocollybia butyracea]
MFRGACVMLAYILLGFQSIISEAYHIPIVRRLDSKPFKLIHPSAKGNITLFHGTSDRVAAYEIVEDQGFDLAGYGASTGDFHSTGVRAGYLTDSIYSAAQFACYPLKFNKDFIPVKRVYVVEFTWEGDT